MNFSSHLSNTRAFHCKNNNNTSNIKNQARIEEYFEPEEFIKKDPVGWFNSLSPAYKEVLGVNAYFESRHKYNYAAQTTKGKMTGRARETVCRIEKYFKSVGVMKSKSMGFTSNVNKISDWFRKNNLAFGISRIMPVFFSIAMLLPKPIVTREYYNDIFIKSNSTAAYALEHNNSTTQSLGNLLQRTLSQFGNNINTIHKGEIAGKEPTNRKSLYERELITKISKVLRCREEDIEKYDISTLEHIKNNHPMMRGK